MSIFVIFTVMGEFEFIDTIRRAFEGVGDGTITGIGDDCAVLPIGGDSRSESFGMPLPSITGRPEAFVVTTDMLVENVHFLLQATSARELGAKSLAVNLSDIAAMGARPVASFLSIALPQECSGGGNAHSGWAYEFMTGYRELSARHNVRLAGGDTTASKGGVAINVTAIGRAPMSNLKYRSGTQAGDIVVVNGPLGESAAGLQDILQGRLDTHLAHIHRNPTSQVAEGEWLGGRAEVHSMIDLSDGLASDLIHILKASGVGAEINLDAIPAPVSLETAVTGGEDYKLLFTIAPDSYTCIADDYRARFGTALYPVGRTIAGPSAIRWLENGVPVEKNWRGFTHF